jgi:hypothetical protein
MKHDEIARLMESVAPTIGDFVSKAMAPLRAENVRLSTSLAAVEQRFADFSTERENDRVFFLTLVKEEIAKVELPVKEIDLVEIERVVTEKVEKAVSALPVPENGKDADPVDLDEVASRAAKLLPVPENGKDASPEAIKAAVLDVVAQVLPGEVSSAVDKIEKPKDGKDVDREELERLVLGITDQKFALREAVYDETVRPIVEEVVAVHVAKIAPAEPGRDGKDVDPAEVAALVSAEVSKAVDAIERPADGKSVTVEDVLPLLQGMVAELPKPENGKDADPEVIRSLVVEEVAKIERPKDGQDGKSVEIEDLILVIEAEVGNAVAGIIPPKGEDGKSVTVDDVLPMLEEMVEKRVATIPVPRDGKDAVVDPVEVANLLVDLMPKPADGKSVSIEDIRPVVEELVASIPKAVDGKDADPVDPSVVAALIVEDVAKLIPPPADGVSITVEEMLPLLEEMVEKRVAAIPRPKDGVGTAGAVIDRSGELVLTLSDGSTKALGVVVGKDADQAEILQFINEKMAEIPRPKDGRDGFGFEDLDATFDGERTISLKFTRADQVKEFSFKMPVVIDRGVYKDGREVPYEKGDGVTFGGSFWIAQKDSPEGKPQDGSNSWRLSVKRGRNGSDGVVKTIPPQGPVKSDPK